MFDACNQAWCQTFHTTPVPQGDGLEGIDNIYENEYKYSCLSLTGECWWLSVTDHHTCFHTHQKIKVFSLLSQRNCALTHLGQKKMTAIQHATVWNAFFIKISLNFAPDSQIDNKSVLVEIMAQSPNEHQAITWIYIDQDVWCYTTSIGHNELVESNIIKYWWSILICTHARKKYIYIYTSPLTLLHLHDTIRL